MLNVDAKICFVLFQDGPYDTDQLNTWRRLHLRFNGTDKNVFFTRLRNIKRMTKVNHMVWVNNKVHSVLSLWCGFMHLSGRLVFFYLNPKPRSNKTFMCTSFRKEKRKVIAWNAAGQEKYLNLTKILDWELMMRIRIQIQTEEASCKINSCCQTKFLKGRKKNN